MTDDPRRAMLKALLSRFEKAKSPSFNPVYDEEKEALIPLIREHLDPPSSWRDIEKDPPPSQDAAGKPLEIMVCWVHPEDEPGDYEGPETISGYTPDSYMSWGNNLVRREPGRAWPTHWMFRPSAPVEGNGEHLNSTSPWRSISEAPKDGTWILGWGRDNAPYRISWGLNRSGEFAWCTAFSCFFDRYIVAWMPLIPPAPVEGEKP